MAWLRSATRLWTSVQPKEEPRFALGSRSSVLTVPVAGRSIWISTTSPSMISVSSLAGERCEVQSAARAVRNQAVDSSRDGDCRMGQRPPACAGAPGQPPPLPGLGATHLMRTPMERRKACVSASVLLISREKISLPAMAVNGVSGPRACAMPGNKGRGAVSGSWHHSPMYPPRRGAQGSSGPHSHRCHTSHSPRRVGATLSLAASLRQVSPDKGPCL